MKKQQYIRGLAAILILSQGCKSVDKQVHQPIKLESKIALYQEPEDLVPHYELPEMLLKTDIPIIYSKNTAFPKSEAWYKSAWRNAINFLYHDKELIAAPSVQNTPHFKESVLKTPKPLILDHNKDYILPEEAKKPADPYKKINKSKPRFRFSRSWAFSLVPDIEEIEEPITVSKNQELIGYRLNTGWGLSLDIEPVYKRKRNRHSP